MGQVGIFIPIEINCQKMQYGGIKLKENNPYSCPAEIFLYDSYKMTLPPELEKPMVFR